MFSTKTFVVYTNNRLKDWGKQIPITMFADLESSVRKLVDHIYHYRGSPGPTFLQYLATVALNPHINALSRYEEQASSGPVIGSLFL